jgi:hypothetical protein
MQQADNVSEDDLYLLHDILMRCEDKERVAVSNTDQIEGQLNIKDYQKGEQAGNEQATEKKDE